MSYDPQSWVEKLQQLHRSAIMVAAAHDVEEGLQMLVDSARELIGAEMAAIGVPGEADQPMALFHVAGIPAEVIEKAGRPPMGRGVLGVLLHDGQPVRLKDITVHEAYGGLPENHPSITSFLGVPVQSRGEVLGDLYLANKIAGDEFTEADHQLAEMLAAYAAVVIQTLRYHEKQEELALVRAKAQLAPKIQDDVLQVLFGAGLLLNSVNLDSPEQAQGQIQDVKNRLDEAIHHLRDHLLSMSAANTP
jgi:GAF domain-containing protein